MPKTAKTRQNNISSSFIKALRIFCIVMVLLNLGCKLKTIWWSYLWLMQPSTPNMWICIPKYWCIRCFVVMQFLCEITHFFYVLFTDLLTWWRTKMTNCETQPPASIGWVALSSVVVRRRSSRIGDISSHLHYMMFPSIQTIYFLWGYDPGNMSVPTYLLVLSWAQFTVV